MYKLQYSNVEERYQFSVCDTMFAPASTCSLISEVSTGDLSNTIIFGHSSPRTSRHSGSASSRGRGLEKDSLAEQVKVSGTVHRSRRENAQAQEGMGGGHGRCRDRRKDAGRGRMPSEIDVTTAHAEEHDQSHPSNDAGDVGDRNESYAEDTGSEIERRALSALHPSSFEFPEHCECPIQDQASEWQGWQILQAPFPDCSDTPLQGVNILQR